jgi:hypothetical protein
VQTCSVVHFATGSVLGSGTPFVACRLVFDSGSGCRCSRLGSGTGSGSGSGSSSRVADSAGCCSQSPSRCCKLHERIEVLIARERGSQITSQQKHQQI